jgi:hypothetical protein
MKSTIFWDKMQCIQLTVNRRFGGTSRLHLQGRRVSQTRNQRESMWQAEPTIYVRFEVLIAVSLKITSGILHRVVW